MYPLKLKIEIKYNLKTEKKKDCNRSYELHFKDSWIRPIFTSVPSFSELLWMF